MSRQRGMIEREVGAHEPPKLKIPIRFELDRPTVVCSRNILSLFEEPQILDERILIMEEDMTSEPKENTLRIWCHHKVWHWRLQTDRVWFVGLESTTTKYKSFLEILLWESHYLPEEIKIYTDSSAHIKRFKVAMARISLQDPRYLVSVAWEVDSEIHSQLAGKKWEMECKAEWNCPHKIEVLWILEDSMTSRPQIYIRHQENVIWTTHQLRDQVMLQEHIEWLPQKHGWSDDICNEIAWNIFHKAITKFQGHQNSIRKYIHGWLPFAEMVKCYNNQEITTCPCCKGREKQDHVLRCPSSLITAKQTELFQGLLENIKDTTEPSLWKDLQVHIQRLVQIPQYEAWTTRNNALDGVTASQNCIGWMNFIQGCMSIKFISHQ